MARGKQTCKILKEIRRQIAEANGIEFVTSECRYKGDCLGTCPKCEDEVRYLEHQLRSRQRMGKAVVIIGISAGMIALSGCGGGENRTPKDSSYTLQGEPVEMVDTLDFEGEVEEQGELPAIEDTIPNSVLSGVKEGEISNTQDIISTVGEIVDVDNNDDKVYEAIVDIRPTFPGGDQKLMEWISQHIVYPRGCYESHIQGRVVIRFMIKADGSVGETEIMRGVYPELDKEALRVVKSLPKFNPAILNGNAVDYWFTLPIVFRLADDYERPEKAKDSVITATQNGIVPGTEDGTDEVKIYQVVEQMPEYSGGQAALLKFIGDNLKYPKELVGCFQGSVRVRFYVDTLGHVCDPQIVRGMDSALDREVLRVIRLFPDFIPGQHEGRKVNVYMNLPISFDPNRY